MCKSLASDWNLETLFLTKLTIVQQQISINKRINNINRGYKTCAITVELTHKWKYKLRVINITVHYCQKRISECLYIVETAFPNCFMQLYLMVMSPIPAVDSEVQSLTEVKKFATRESEIKE